MGSYEQRKRLLQISAEAIRYKAEETRMILCNLGCEESAEAAKAAGLLNTYSDLIDLQSAKAEIDSMLIDLENHTGWRHIGEYFGGGVYICPKCDKKSPEDFVFCPNCGRIIGRGVMK